MKEHSVAVIIPALNEAASIEAVVRAMPAELVDLTIVVDNGSSDATAEVARAAGAVVVSESRRGYGWACRAGCAAAGTNSILVFMDGDGSMSPRDIEKLVAPILRGTADIVCGRRYVNRALMPWHQRAGNRVIAFLLRVLHGVSLHELGSFRAVRASTMAELDLPGSRFAWPAQFLARAARIGARIDEITVGYSARTGGRSKVGGSLRGSLAAAWDISSVLVRERRR